MKKTLYSIIAVILIIMTVSCQKEREPEVIRQIEYIEDPSGRLEMITSYYTVHPEQWMSASDVSYLFAPFENSDITKKTIEDGCVLVYLIDSEDRDNPLPYEIFQTGTDNNNNLVYYSDTFSFDAEQGRITFKFQASDFNNEQSLAAYGDIVFKVVVLRHA